MKERLLLFIAVSVALIQILIFFPVVIWLSNQFNFSVPLTESVFIYLYILATIFFCSGLLAMVIPGILRQFLLPLFVLLNVLIFIQQNILVWDYGILQGDGIDFSNHTNSQWVDLSVWLAALTALIFFRKKIVKHTSVLLMFSTTASTLVFLLALTSIDHEATLNPYSITENNKFKFSKDKNVMLFILDGFQSDLFWHIIDQEPELTNLLPGFTFYPDTTAVFSKTYPTVPMLLTGQVYQKEQPIQTFLKDVYDDSLLTDLIDDDWDVGLYPYKKNLIPVNGEIMSNFIDNIEPLEKVENYLQALDLSLFRSSPHSLKPVIFNEGDFLVKNAVIEYIENQQLIPADKEAPKKLPKVNKHRGINFLENLKTHADTDSINPTFRFYHLLMPHSPFTLDRNLRPVPKSGSFQAYQDYAYASLKLMISYLKEFEKLGIYDQSAIIIAADHGGGEYTRLKYNSAQGEFTYINELGKEMASGKPLLLVKGFGDNNPFELSAKPVSLLDIMPTLASFSDQNLDAPGIEINELRDNQPRERPFYYYNFTGFDSKYLEDFRVFNITGHVYDETSWNRLGILSAQEQMPQSVDKYQLNKTVRFGADLKADADYQNQFLVADNHQLLHSSIQSIHQQFLLNLPLDQPLNNNGGFQLEIELLSMTDLTDVTISIDNKEWALIKVVNKKLTYLVPFIAGLSNSKELSIKIEGQQMNNDHELYLSKLKISNFNIASLDGSDGIFGVDFSKDIEKFHPEGFWAAKHLGRWTGKRQSSLLFKAPKNFCHNKSVRINILRFYTHVDPDQLQVYMNGIPLNLDVFEESDRGGRKYHADCPAITNEQQNLIELKFQTNTTTSPSAVSDSKDRRKFGIELKSFEVINTDQLN